MYSVDLPCKPGDDYWWVDDDTLEIHHVKGGITGVGVYQDGIKVFDSSNVACEIGSQWCCLSLEDAEAVREKMMQKCKV